MTVCNIKLQLYLKQAEQEPEYKIDEEKPDEKVDGEDEFVPVVIRPGHIRFEPLEEGQTVTLSLTFAKCLDFNLFFGQILLLFLK